MILFSYKIQNNILYYIYSLNVFRGENQNNFVTKETFLGINENITRFLLEAVNR